MDPIKLHVKSTRFILLVSMMILVAGMILPQSIVVASTAPVPVQMGEEIGTSGTDVLTSQYLRLKKMYNRKEKEVKPLEAGLQKLLNDYKTLYNKGNKHWGEMRVYFYDYFSAYYAAKEHRLEGKLLIENHNGFSSTGKVTNRPMAKYTITRLQGTVLLLSARIDECHRILREGKRFMKQNSTKDN